MPRPKRHVVLCLLMAFLAATVSCATGSNASDDETEREPLTQADPVSQTEPSTEPDPESTPTAKDVDDRSDADVESSNADNGETDGQDQSDDTDTERHPMARRGAYMARSTADYACFISKRTAKDPTSKRQAAPLTAKTNATSKGTIDAQETMKVVKQRRPEFKTCYECALRRSPDISGKLYVEFRIEPSGYVSDARVVSDDIDDELMLDCVRRQVQRWTFPAPEGGAARIRAPFVFSPRD